MWLSYEMHSLGGRRLAATIQRIRAREVLDSRGRPTVEVEVWCTKREGSVCGRAIAPSGASTGTHEAHELRDGDPEWFDGLGVQQAVRNVNETIAPALRGQDPFDQRAIDRRLCELDGTPQKSRLGANAILPVSLACAHAAANAAGKPLYEHIYGLWRAIGRHHAEEVSTDFQLAWGEPGLPVPMINMISGGLHAGQKMALQDILIIPWGACSMRQCLSWAVRIYRRLQSLLRERGLEWALVGDEGGFGPAVATVDEALGLVLEAIERSGLEPGRDVAMALDVAATHFYRDGGYVLKELGDRPADVDALLSVLRAWTSHFPIVSLEDPCAEDDWAGWEKATQCFGPALQLVGDDLFVTNVERLRVGIARGVANTVLVKPNQVGTLSETLELMALARQAGYWCVVSARSGETEDTTIAHLAVATGAGQIKIGSVCRSERLAKYNELLRIEECAGPSLQLAGHFAVGAWGAGG